MRDKCSRAIAGIVVVCVLAFVCAGALREETTPRVTPRAAQCYCEGDCPPVLWGMNYTLYDSSSTLGAKANVTLNYTICAGSNLDIDISWSASQVTNVTIGTTLLASSSSGSVYVSYSQLPAYIENITLINNGTSSTTVTYEIILVNPTPAPQMARTAPIQGGGVVIAVVYGAIILLGMGSLKIPLKFQILALLGTIIMPIVWFDGGSATNVAPPQVLYGMSEGEFDFEESERKFRTSTPFTIPEDSGLVISAYINFKADDPIYVGFTFVLYRNEDPSHPIPVYAGEFGLASEYSGDEFNSTFIPLLAGDYLFIYSTLPWTGMDVSLHVLSAWSDIGVGTTIGSARYVFLLLDVIAAVIALVAIVKVVRKKIWDAQVKKIHKSSPPSASVISPGILIDVPLTDLYSFTNAPSTPVADDLLSQWVCKSCGIKNGGVAKYCSACGNAQKPE